MNHYVRVILSLACSFALSVFLTSHLFIEKNPIFHWETLNATIQQTNQQVASGGSKIFSSFLSKFSTKTVSPTPLPQTAKIQANAFPTNIDEISPTQDLPVPTEFIEPSSTPFPTEVLQSPTTPVPTKTPPTPTVRPTPNIGFPKITGDPLKQPWYGANSLRCYSQDRFIQVYANGVIPDKCRKNVQYAVYSQLTSVTLLGRSITVHKKALAAFQAVADELDYYKAESNVYKFPSKTYTIKTVGAYIFRCNISSKISDPFDTCSSACSISSHSFGIAVDINEDDNLYGSTNFDMPKEIYETFESYGFRWDGHYPLIGSKIDSMHFEYMKDLCEIIQ